MGMKRILRHSGWIAWKDLLEFSRSRLRLIMLVLMPLFMMVMVGYIFPSGSSISNQPVALANEDLGVAVQIPPGNVATTVYMGNDFVNGLTAINNRTGMMDLSNATGFDAIKAEIQEGTISGGIIIPPDFSECLMAGEQANITIVTDQSNPQLSAMMESVLGQTITAMGTQWAAYNLNTTYHISISRTQALIQPFSVQFTGIVPGNPNYFQFVAPGIIAMVVMMSLMT